MNKRAFEWENMCSKCGLCCHEKVIVGNTVIYDLETYCEYYDPTTRQCKIYFERLEANSRCKRVNRFRAMFAPYLPESCAYVQWARAHKIRFAPKRHIRYARGDLCGSSDDDLIASH